MGDIDLLREEYEIRHDIEVADAIIAALGDEIAELTGQNIDLEVWRASAVKRAEQAEAERDERLTLEESSRLAEKVDKAEFALKEMSERYRRERDRRVLAEERQRVAEAENERMKCCGNCARDPQTWDECDDCTWDNSQWTPRPTEGGDRD